MTHENTVRADRRDIDCLRPVRLTLGAMKFAEGSALIELGDTKVLVSASLESRVPAFLKDSGKGWLTAEYAMLPRATHTRSQRDSTRGHASGRSTEIQRLIGRSLRAAVDLSVLGERTLMIDCDVLQADGGTRTAAITAAWVAAVEALAHLFLSGDLERWPVVAQVAAVSVGMVRDRALLDLEYREDQEAQVDMNVVGTAEGSLVEIQGTGERRTFSRAELDLLVDLGFKGIRDLAVVQNAALADLLAEVEAVRAKSSRRPARAKDERQLWGPPG